MGHTTVHTESLGHVCLDGHTYTRSFRGHGPIPSTLQDVHGAGGRRHTHTHCLGELDQNSCFLLGAGDTVGGGGLSHSLLGAVPAPTCQ